MSNTYRELSKSNYVPNEPLTVEDLKLGCLQRIAGATEAMAINYVQLQKDAAFWRTEYYHEKNRRESFERSIVAHKANYTRLKRKYEELKNANG